MEELCVIPVNGYWILLLVLLYCRVVIIDRTIVEFIIVVLTGIDCYCLFGDYLEILFSGDSFLETVF